MHPIRTIRRLACIMLAGLAGAVLAVAAAAAPALATLPPPGPGAPALGHLPPPRLAGTSIRRCRARSMSTPPWPAACPAGKSS
jgi:hypothetical protein